MPSTADCELMAKGNIPLRPMGWLKMRPDLATSQANADKSNQRSSATEQRKLCKRYFPCTLTRAISTDRLRTCKGIRSDQVAAVLGKLKGSRSVISAFSVVITHP